MSIIRQIKLTTVFASSVVATILYDRRIGLVVRFEP